MALDVEDPTHSFSVHAGLGNRPPDQLEIGLEVGKESARVSLGPKVGCDAPLGLGSLKDPNTGRKGNRCPLGLLVAQAVLGRFREPVDAAKLIIAVHRGARGSHIVRFLYNSTFADQCEVRDLFCWNSLGVTPYRLRNNL